MQDTANAGGAAGGGASGGGPAGPVSGRSPNIGGVKPQKQCKMIINEKNGKEKAYIASVYSM